MIRFGPAGNSDSFYAQGYKASWQAPAWLRGMRLSAYEYSFGRGIQLSEDMAAKIAGHARENDIAVSVHAPYFINLSNPDRDKLERSFRDITDSARLVTLLGGDRVVIHAGAAMKLEREEAVQNCREGLLEAYRRLDDLGLPQVHLCPETMGRPSQIGNLRETLDFCLLDERFVPCIDFAHLHALGQGALNAPEDFAAVLDEIQRSLGMERARAMHVHFSAIEFGRSGEKRHRTFAEEKYGPRFEHLAPLLKERGYAPRVICECHGTMAEDARTMMEIFQAL
ncbi:MAG: TIM barrel protein [Clostridia bacterium]|nr:TIM barrel protein [Clostridia bacterium]